MSTDTALPTENLFRAIYPGVEVRDAGEGPPILSVRFAVFDEWAEINSDYEGHFLERFMPGSLDESLAAETPKVLYQHGHDVLGRQVIAAPVTTRVDAEGATIEGPLLDGVPPLIAAGLRAGAYGASMQFHVEEQDVVRNAKPSDYNPRGLPERSVTKAWVREGGPVTWGAYDGATASIRSLTDEFRPHDFDREITRMAREHPSDLAKVIERALKGSEPPKAAAPEAAPAPRFRTREEYLEWMSKV